MYLKALNVVGFKSFADKTVVQFHPGVTAIVGPNGCGKSNVLDSIRWVLGEQSAKALRGGQMSDVIFNGSEKRKPLGMAEVSLTFGDCEKELGTEYNEVTITRRLFRDGSSEYEINKSLCRLKDIHQLFMDTGVGRTAYSIMEQGKIDQILSARPEDRRAVFEEAAGITRFKSQRKEALRKLEQTEANMIRLEDVVGEVRRQIGSLQRQAAKARRYQELFAELRDLELKYARREYKNLVDDITALQERTDSSRQTHLALAQAVEEEDAALGRFREELEGIEGQAAQVREALNEARLTGERAVQRETTNSLRVEEFTLLRENARIELAGTAEKIRIQEEQLAALEAQIASAAETRAAAEAAHREKEEGVRAVAAQVSDKEAERDNRRHDLGRLQSSLVGQRNQLIALEAQHRNLLLRIEALRAEQDSLALRRTEAEERRIAQEAEVAQAEAQVVAAQQVVAEREAVVEERRALVSTAQQVVEERRAAISIAQQVVEERRAGITAAENAVAEKEQEVAARRQAIRTAEEALREVEREHRDLLSAHGRIAAKVEALKQLEASHAGSPPATQHLLACKVKGEIAARIEGTLIDHLSVAPGNEEAISLLLGEAVNALVVDDRAGAEELLAKARATNEGRGQVVIAPVSLARNVGALSFDETDALKAVQITNPLVTPLVESLLSEAHIVDSLAAAWDLKARLPQALVATRDGTLITRSGLVRAGKAGGEEAALAVFTRRTERAALEEEAAAALTLAEQGAARVVEANTAVEVARASVEEAQLAVAAAQQGIREAQDFVEAARGGVAEAQSHVAEAQSHVAEAQSHVAEAQRHVSEAQQDVRDAEISIATRRHTQETLGRAVLDLEAARERAGQEAGRIVEQIGGDEERRQGIEAAVAEGESRIASVEAEVAAIGEEVSALEEQEAFERRILVESQIGVAGLVQQHQGALQQRDAVRQRLGELRELTSTRVREADDYASRISQAETEITLAREEKELVSLIVGEKEMALQETLALKTAQQGRITEREEALRIERRKLGEIQNDQTAAEIKLTERRIRLDHLVERITQTYQLALSEQPGLTEEEEASVSDWSVVEGEVSSRREKIEGMGPVNIEAIAEFEELQQRLTFLETQEADLRNGKEQLLLAINEINQTTQQLFATTFEQVKINFQQIFTELFGGGKAELKLVDENDPLECGIDIVAKPPGKQPQSITLLSGGEKTMTAVALLFSIYMVKPSPFCVLDEMDAPLDESNINRFIKMVQRFTEHSQFVVITHNKRTIGVADAIFGVTMQERGVSRLMSVKLTPDGEVNPEKAKEEPKAEASEPSPAASRMPATDRSEGEALTDGGTASGATGDDVALAN